MKQLILITISVFFSFTLFSQQGNNFKTKNKKQIGSANFNLPYKTITGNSSVKSGSLNSKYKAFPISSNQFTSVVNPNNTLKNLVLHEGSPIFFEKEKNPLKSAKIESIEEQYYTFFTATKNITQLSNPREELYILDQSTDELGITHIKAQQYFKGVKIYGAESYLHIGKSKEIFNGRIYSTDETLDVSPKISKESATKNVIADLKLKTKYRALSDKEKDFLQYYSPEVTLVIYNAVLAFEIAIRANFMEEWKYFVDANSGEILFGYNNTKFDGPTTANAADLKGELKTINTSLENGTYYLKNIVESMYNQSTKEGIITTYNANNSSINNLNVSHFTSSNNIWNIPVAVSAHYNATLTFKYLKNTFDRNSINGLGGNIDVFVNVVDDDGSGWDNACWNGKAVFFGNGKELFKPLAQTDCVAHEIGHGIVENTANLEYYGQSGALNDGYCDIFGSMVDRDDWLIGEDIVLKSAYPSGAMRSMSDPHNSGSSFNDPYWQPNHVSEMYIGEADNGGVHLNCSIGSHPFYLFATATNKEKAEQVFYRALTKYLTKKSQFVDYRIAVIQSTKDLYGESSTEVTEARNAFDKVGISEEIKVTNTQTLPVNPGQDYLLVNSTYPNDYPLYRSSTAGNNFIALSGTPMISKPSVTDDGSVALFVSSDNQVLGVSTDPNNLQEMIFFYDPYWENVAVSKDGNRIAVVSTEVDAAIYVFDIISNRWAKFDLYNPTTSQDNSYAGGVAFADAIEFDNTGEFLIYDAFNVLNSTTEEDINYWDIGFINVWDNNNNNFGNGKIFKIFGSLPNNVSVGNPTFSKNSPDIIAFDYYNGSTDEYEIWGLNLTTGDLNYITSNATIGYPSFSKNDDKIAFSSLDSNNDDVVGVINLNSDKISSSSQPYILITKAKWPVFYATGKRNLILGPVANFTVDIKTGNAPLSVRFIDMSNNKPSSWSWSFPGGSPSTSNLQNPTVLYSSPGTYNVILTCSNSTGNNTMTKNSYITVSNGVGISDIPKEFFSYYPNPVSDKLFIESQKEFRVKIYSVSGDLLVDEINKEIIDVWNLKSGLYLLKIETDGKVITNKLIKN